MHRKSLGRVFLQPQREVRLNLDCSFLPYLGYMRFNVNHLRFILEIFGGQFANFAVPPIGTDTGKKTEREIGNQAPGFA